MRPLLFLYLSLQPKSILQTHRNYFIAGYRRLLQVKLTETHNVSRRCSTFAANLKKVVKLDQQKVDFMLTFAPDFAKSDFTK